MSSYRPQSLDTTEEVDRRQFDLWREMPDWRKLQLFGDLCDSAKAMAEAGLRERYPDADDHEIKMRLAATWLDRAEMIKFYGWDPVEHPTDS
jgi:hypothetical protein